MQFLYYFKAPERKRDIRLGEKKLEEIRRNKKWVSTVRLGTEEKRDRFGKGHVNLFIHPQRARKTRILIASCSI